MYPHIWICMPCWLCVNKGRLATRSCIACARMRMDSSVCVRVITYSWIQSGSSWAANGSWNIHVVAYYGIINRNSKLTYCWNFFVFFLVLLLRHAVGLVTAWKFLISLVIYHNYNWIYSMWVQWRTQLSSKTRAKFHVVMTPQYMYTDMVYTVIHIQLNRLPNCVWYFSVQYMIPN